MAAPADVTHKKPAKPATRPPAAFPPHTPHQMDNPGPPSPIVMPPDTPKKEGVPQRKLPAGYHEDNASDGGM